MRPSFLPTLPQELLFVLHARYMIAGCLAVCLLVAGAYNHGVRPLYKARAGISLQEASTLGQPSYDVAARNEAFNRQLVFLKSHELSATVMERHGAEITQELAAGPLGTGLDRALGEVRHLLRLDRRTALTSTERLDVFRSRLNIENEPPSTWVYVTFFAYDPESAAKAANAVADEYIRVSRQQNAKAREVGQAALEAELRQRQAKLGQRLTELSAERTDGPADRKVLLERQAVAFEEGLVAARVRRLAMEARLREATGSGGRAYSSATTTPETREARALLDRAQGHLDGLLAIYGDKHPAVVKARDEVDAARGKLEKALGVARSALESDARLALDEERRLQVAAEQARRDLYNVRPRSMSDEVGEEITQADRQALTDLARRPGAGAPFILDATLVERAERPTEPVSPQRARNYGYGAIAGIAIAAAFLWIERSNDTLLAPEEVKTLLGLECLGILPTVPSMKASDIPATVHLGSNSLADACRVVRTNLAFMIGDGITRVVVVTSPAPGEGKSTFATMLSVVLARASSRVLVIDGDIRKPTLHSTLTLDQTRGLSNLLGGSVTDWHDVVQQTAVPGLDAIPSGPLVTHPGEALLSPALKAMFAAAREEYAWVIVDAPPALGMADASLLGTFATGVIIVAAAGRSRLGSLRAVVAQLSAVKATPLGVVLNRVDFQRQSYHYGGYYSAAYGGHSYSQSPDPPAPKP